MAVDRELTSSKSPSTRSGAVWITEHKESSEKEGKTIGGFIKAGQG